MTNRILPETLPALYEKHGVVPIQGTFHVRRPGLRCACGLGIAFIGLTNGYAVNDTDALVRTLVLDIYYGWGYLHGWDEGEPFDASGWGPEQQSNYAIGYADGAAGWAAVKDLAVTR